LFWYAVLTLAATSGEICASETHVGVGLTLNMLLSSFSWQFGLSLF